MTRPLRRLEEAAAAVGRRAARGTRAERRGPAGGALARRVFNETVAKLERLLRSQEEFVADASHELRTPLTALRLRLESLPPRRRTATRRCGRPTASGISSTACSRSRVPTPASEAPARVDAAAVVRERLRSLAAARRRARRRRSSRGSNGPLPVRAVHRDGSSRCSTTSSRTRSRCRRPDGDGHAVGRAPRRPWVELHVARRGARPHAGAARARVRPLLARRLRARAARVWGSRSCGGSSMRTTARSSSARRPAAASTPSSGCARPEPEPLPKPCRVRSPAPLPARAYNGGMNTKPTRHSRWPPFSPRPSSPAARRSRPRPPAGCRLAAPAAVVQQAPARAAQSWSEGGTDHAARLGRRTLRLGDARDRRRARLVVPPAGAPRRQLSSQTVIVKGPNGKQRLVVLKAPAHATTATSAVARP